MKLLLDENLSPRLIEDLRGEYPDSSHVREFGLQSADDKAIWDFAGQEQYTVVSKDADFRQMSFLYGPPPKVIWIRLGNCSTDQILEVLRASTDRIAEFRESEEAAFLVLE